MRIFEKIVISFGILYFFVYNIYMRKVVSGILAVFLSMAIACGCLLLSGIFVPKSSQNTTEIVDEQDKGKNENNAKGNWLDYASASLVGEGTENSPFKISTPNDLAKLAKMENEEVEASIAASGEYEASPKYYELTADIDLSAHEWTPIQCFTGNFNGNGHKVKITKTMSFLRQELSKTNSLSLCYMSDRGWVCEFPGDSKTKFEEDAVGLFANVLVGVDSSKSSLSDTIFEGELNLEGYLQNSSRWSSLYLGGVIGFGYNVVLHDIVSSVSLNIEGGLNEYGKLYAGGIVGLVETGVIYNCSYRGTLIYDIPYDANVGFDIMNVNKHLCFGGIAGCLRPGFVKTDNGFSEKTDNFTDWLENEVQNCYFEKDAMICYSRDLGSWWQDWGSLCIGGILGSFCGKEIVGCASMGEIKVIEFTQDGYCDYGLYMGGILGCLGVPGKIDKNGWFYNKKSPQFYANNNVVHIADCTNHSNLELVDDRANCDEVFGGIIGGFDPSGAFFNNSLIVYIVGCTNFGSTLFLKAYQDFNTPESVLFAGGILGRVDKFSKYYTYINDCINLGTIGYYIINGKFGGIVGYAGSGKGVIERCINIGVVSGSVNDSTVGGIAGFMRSNTFAWFLVNCISPFAPTSTKGGALVGSLNGEVVSLAGNLMAEGEGKSIGNKKNDYGLGGRGQKMSLAYIKEVLAGNIYWPGFFEGTLGETGSDPRYFSLPFTDQDVVNGSSYSNDAKGAAMWAQAKEKSKWLRFYCDNGITEHYGFSFFSGAKIYCGGSATGDELSQLILPFGAVGRAFIYVEANKSDESSVATSVENLFVDQSKVLFIKGRNYENIEYNEIDYVTITFAGAGDGDDFYVPAGYTLENDVGSKEGDFLNGRTLWLNRNKKFNCHFRNLMPKVIYNNPTLLEEDINIHYIFIPKKITRRIIYTGPENADNDSFANKYLLGGKIINENERDNLVLDLTNSEVNKWYSIECYYGEKLQFELDPRVGYYAASVYSSDGLQERIVTFPTDSNAMAKSEFLPIFGDITITFKYVNFNFNVAVVEPQGWSDDVNLYNATVQKIYYGKGYAKNEDIVHYVEKDKDGKEIEISNISQSLSITTITDDLKLEYGYEYSFYGVEVERFRSFIDTMIDAQRFDTNLYKIASMTNKDRFEVKAKDIIDTAYGRNYYFYNNLSNREVCLVIYRSALPFHITMHEMLNDYDALDVYTENKSNSINDVPGLFSTTLYGSNKYYWCPYAVQKTIPFPYSVTHDWGMLILNSTNLIWDDTLANRYGYKTSLQTFDDEGIRRTDWLALTFCNILTADNKIDDNKLKSKNFLISYYKSGNSFDKDKDTKTFGFSDVLAGYAQYLSSIGVDDKDGDIFGDYFIKEPPVNSSPQPGVETPPFIVDKSYKYGYYFDFYIYYDLQQYNLEISIQNTNGNDKVVDVKVDGNADFGTETDEGIYKIYYYQPVTLTAKDAENAKFAGMYLKDTSKILTTSMVFEFANKPTEYTTTRDGRTVPMESLSILLQYADFANAGTEPDKKNGVYLIDSAEDLVWMSVHVEDEINDGFANCLFKQTCDIDMSDIDNFLPIGFSVAFKGAYDSGFKKIKNLKLFGGEYQNNLSNMGLFGQTDGATIKNLMLFNYENGKNIAGYGNVGTVVGRAKNSTFRNISNINVGVSLSETEHYNIYGEKITTQDDAGAYKVRRNIAGFAGVAEGCSFVGCSNQGDVKAGVTQENVAALVGFGQNGTTIDQCFSESENTVDVLVNGVEARNSYCNSNYFGQTDNSDIWTTLNEKKVLKIFYWLY